MFHKKCKPEIENNFAKVEQKTEADVKLHPTLWSSFDMGERKGRQVNWKETTLKLQPSLQGILYVGVSHSKHNKLCTFERKRWTLKERK